MQSLKDTCYTVVADICMSSYRYQIIQKNIQRNIKIRVQEIVQYFNMILDKLIFLKIIHCLIFYFGGGGVFPLRGWNFYQKSFQ